MRFAWRVILATITLSGCSGDAAPPTRSTGAQTPNAPAAPPASTPTSPQPGASSDTLASFWGMVVDRSGVCITGATAQVERGRTLDAAVTQDPNCDAWAYGGGFTLERLEPGVEITLLVSAPGYASREVQVTPVMDQRAIVVIELGGGGAFPSMPGTLDRLGGTSTFMR